MVLKPYWFFITGIILLTLLVVYSRHADRELLPYEGFASSGSTFYMFGVDWCPHCTSTKPEFLALGSTMTIGGTSVDMKLVNPEQEPDVAAEFPIEGYPTLYLVQKNGEKIKYQGQRNTESFRQFLQKNVA
jgi:thiol-disulfide isomerase/thioredoxin